MSERRLEPVKQVVEATDVFKVHSVEAGEVFQRKLNKLNTMADLGRDCVKALDVCLDDKDGYRDDGWHFRLPEDVVNFLKNAFEAALEAGAGGCTVSQTTGRWLL